MIPVVLSGGMGTRLWPMSRQALPKQFCELLDESLLEKTLRRLLKLGSPWTLTTTELRTLTDRVYRQLHIPDAQVLLEPMARNTAPAVAFLCKALELQGKQNEVVGIFPADHLVLKEDEFQRAVALAKVCALKGYVATLGIRPDYPATGFGYIETAPQSVEAAGDLKAFQVKGFREKPNLETAQKFLAQGNFSWNAGIFVFQVKRMIEHFKNLMPELWAQVAKLAPDHSNLTSIYGAVKGISLDYGIMEKLNEQVCIPCEIGWSDLGSWDDVSRFSEPPYSLEFSNQANVVSHSSKDCFVFSSDEKVCGLVGVEGLIVVDTSDALLIARKGLSQDVRHIVDKLHQVRNVTAREHRFELRPWGGFKVLRDEAHYKSKVVTVNPKHQLSYQSHDKRAEHWVIVRGAGEVVLDNVTRQVRAGESVFIPQGTKHRIRNTGVEVLEFVEVQTGSYFGEDDIKRYEDDYKRI